MLRVKHARADRGWHRLPTRVALALAILVVGCVGVAGARPPLDGSLIVPIQLGDLNGAFAIRVGEIFSAPERADLARELNEALLTRLKQTGVLPLRLPVRVQDMEQFIGRLTVTVKEDGGQVRGVCTLGLSAIRMNEACDWAKIIKAECPDVEEVVRRNGATIYEVPWAPPDVQPLEGLPPFQMYVPDARTIVLEGGSVIARLIEANKTASPSPDWTADWKEVEGGLVAMVIDNPGHRYAIKLARGEQTEEDKHFAELKRKVFRYASRLVFGVDGSPGLRLKARLTCDNSEDAEQLEKLLRDELKTLSVGAVRAKADEKAQLLQSLLAGVALRRAGKQVVLTAESRKYGVEALGRLLGLLSAPPAVGPLAEPEGPVLTPVSAEVPALPLPALLPPQPGLSGGMPPLPQPSSVSELLGYPLPPIGAPAVRPGGAKRQ